MSNCYLNFTNKLKCKTNVLSLFLNANLHVNYMLITRHLIKINLFKLEDYLIYQIDKK